mmetsp:Transcript_9925/g.16479  ORF Transcript_9925/g.16479 Transcript_9925/m.16479 type:complete len:409 (-) Transcript_9925:410-1636(-)|eukprot:CAMPEP_0119016334 /NCGR_PEP_ID=MMETSP1176-20130426/12232_1 /TAXON_ID=265551 /ORGANISM="Synedropsis recta cf, Strain CCMP1620" /LENGTH=408 /DNA_ID=CAMNT_0006969691 /DNA_START=126 /DNA_END=1352 /DNA_ORIENTATION=-
MSSNSTDDFLESLSSSSSSSSYNYSVQTILLAVVPKFPAALSILGSLFIVLDVTRSQKRRKLLSNRIMVGLSCSDILASTVYFLGTWFIPRGTTGQYGPIFLAAGNTATCNTSGFFTQLAICSPLYNASLCLYYLLSTKYVWSDRALNKLEPLLHAVPICFALGTATAGLILNLYGSVEWLCWVNPVIPSDTTWIYQWAFLFVPLWAVVVFVSYVMFSLWWTMRKQEQKMAILYQLRRPETTSVVATGTTDIVDMMDGTTNTTPAAAVKTDDRSSIRGTSRSSTAQRGGSVINNNNRSVSKKIAVQGMMYVVAFYITWFFPSLQRIIELAAGKNFFVLQFFDTTLLPLQGLLNVIIFVRPRYASVRRRRQNQELKCCRGFWHTISTIVRESLCPDGVTTASGVSSDGI